ncbi:hypothetical protein [Neobacillus piezotolerans]|uniref:hypothetical protein n=1 Tax=Neobacillus piezotolerans TaxID=2259171 RepID=UPI0015F1388B|nr:hypothetical protein [Neobacillus piezotolerans]
MQKKNQEQRPAYSYEEKGIQEVSAQIMDAYNSGFMGEEEARERTDEYPVMRGDLE